MLAEGKDVVLAAAGYMVHEANKALDERSRRIADGLAAKKLSPAQAEALRAGTGFLASLSTAQLRSYLAEAAPQLAADVRAPAALPSAEAEVTLTDEEKRQAKAMRVSEADMLATKKQHLGR